jgi:hypothetical protein
MNKDNNYKLKLKDLIVNSRLSTDQKELWEIFLKISDENEDEAVFEAASEDEESLTLLTNHLRDKIRDMNEKGRNAWQRLLAMYNN